MPGLHTISIAITNAELKTQWVVFDRLLIGDHLAGNGVLEFLFIL
jgi:hypothetical protein